MAFFTHAITWLTESYLPLTVPGMLNRNLLQHCLHMTAIHLNHGPIPIKKKSVICVFKPDSITSNSYVDLL